MVVASTLMFTGKMEEVRWIPELFRRQNQQKFVMDYPRWKMRQKEVSAISPEFLDSVVRVAPEK